MFLLIVKILVVVIFLIMFLRGNKLIWGIGLLTVTTAILLDSFLGTFGRDQMLEELGFFFYVISGALAAGAAIWLWGLLKPLVTASEQSRVGYALPEGEKESDAASAQHTAKDPGDAFDREMLSDQLRDQLGRDDLLDLLFDLNLNENDVTGSNMDAAETALRIIDLAEEKGQLRELTLGVERILTPVPADSLPRPEKLSADSPPTVLRHYLLANYTLEELRQMTAALVIDWEVIAGEDKRSKSRNLLLHLYRQQRVNELVTLIQATVASRAAPNESTNS